MEELIVYKTYDAAEAETILASFKDAGISAYAREKAILRRGDIPAAPCSTFVIDIVIDEGSEDDAVKILEDLGCIEMAGSEENSDDDPVEYNEQKVKAFLLDDLAMEYETAVFYLDKDDYLEQFFDLNFTVDRICSLTVYDGELEEAFSDLCGEDAGKLIAEKTESYFGIPKRILFFDDTAKVTDELEASSDGWGVFYIVSDAMFLEYDGFALCFVSGTNN